jgi:hypothetical protein
MKRIHVGLIFVICILLTGLSFSSLLAEDFSFIGINWNDDLDSVRTKVEQSGLFRDSWFIELQRESITLSSIIKDPLIDEEKHKELTNESSRIQKEVRIEHQLKYIEFRGKRDSMVKSATFFFTYDRDILLSYFVSLNTSVATSDARTGEGEFYQDLVKKYGTPTMLKGSKVWSKKDQSLYYTPTNDAVIVTYISDSNLSGYIDRLEGKPKKPEETNMKEIKVY